MRTLLLSLLFGAFILPPAAAQSRIEDVDMLYRQITETHPAPFRVNTPEQWSVARDQLLAAADTMTEDAFLVALSQFAAMAEDGHTNLLPFYMPPDSFRQRFPVRFEVFADGVFITHTDTANQHLLGLQVQAINGHEIRQVRDAFATLLGGDNPQWDLRWFPILLTYPNYLEGLSLGRGDRTGAQEFTLVGPSGHQQVDLRPTGDAVELVSAQHVSGSPVPEDRAYDFVFWPEDATVYAVYREVADSEAESVAEFADRLFAFIETHPVERLIFDIRENGGGNNYLNQPLLHGMIRSRINQPGGLYILTGRATFSAAMNLATRIERHTQALFAGEPTAASPNHYGDPEFATLPSSGLPYIVSTLYWQDSQPGDPRLWIYPDIEASTQFGDWQAGRDPVIDAVRAYQLAPDTPAAPPVTRWRRDSQATQPQGM